jgi:hypothetical protein
VWLAGRGLRLADYGVGVPEYEVAA